jgi:hypothetical protein
VLRVGAVGRLPRDGKITATAVRDAAPVLPDGYTDEAKAVAERQIVLAGYRLADVLKETVSD